MRAALQVAKYEYTRIVRQRSFLFFALGMPLFFIAIGFVPVLVTILQGQPNVGYVDEAGLMLESGEESDDLLSGAVLIPYESEEAGRSALAAGEIDGLWIIPEDYLQTGRVRSISEGESSGRQRDAIAGRLRASLLADVPAGMVERIQAPVNLTFLFLDTGQRLREGAEFVIALLIPIGLSVLFALSISFSSGFLAQALAEEKENRLIEILVTSISVRSLLGGKVVGLGAIALTQLLLWGVGIFIAALLFFLRGDLPRGIPVPWDIVLWAIPLFLLAYLLYSTLLVGIGVIVGESREAQQVSGIVGILAIVPIWFAVPLVEEPSGTIARILSLVPFTAPTVIPVRLALGAISVAEILVSLLILLGSVLVVLWLVSGLYRAAMLRYGSRMSINEIVSTVGRRVRGGQHA
jgi:ABC-2 type transport system permease protein